MKMTDSPTPQQQSPATQEDSLGDIVHFSRRMQSEPATEPGLSGAFFVVFVILLAGLVLAGLLMSGGAALLFGGVAFPLLVVVTLPVVLVSAAMRR